MKIQSSLLILAATVGSAAAANKRKRVFKIYSREEIQAAEGRRSLQGGKNEKNPKPEEVLPEMESMSMTLAPSAAPMAAMSMMTNCAFCSGKEMDADFDLGVQGQTCGSVQTAVSAMAATNPNCALAKQAEAICCPDVVTPVVTTTSATVTMPVSTEAAVETTTTEAASVPVPVPSPPETTPAIEGAPNSAMALQTTLAGLAIAGTMMLV